MSEFCATDATCKCDDFHLISNSTPLKNKTPEMNSLIANGIKLHHLNLRGMSLSGKFSFPSIFRENAYAGCQYPVREGKLKTTAKQTNIYPIFPDQIVSPIPNPCQIKKTHPNLRTSLVPP